MSNVSIQHLVRQAGKNLLGVICSPKSCTLVFSFFCATVMLSAQWVYTSGYSNQAQKRYLQRINVQTLEIVDMAPSIGQELLDIAFHPDGTLYGIDLLGTLFTIDTLTGTRTFVVQFPFTYGTGMTIDYRGDFYLTKATATTLSVLKIDINTLEEVVVSSFGEFNSNHLDDMDFYDGHLYAVGLLPPSFVERQALFKVDTGVLVKHDTIVKYEKWQAAALASINDSCGSEYLFAPTWEQLQRFYPDEDTVLIVDMSSYPNYRAAGASSLTSHLGSIPPLRIDDIVIDKDPCDSNALAEVTVQIRAGRPPAVEYSLEDTTYQDSARFTNIAPGTYQAFVRDAWGCSRMSDPFTITPTAGFDVEVTLEPAYCGMDNWMVSVFAKRSDDSLVFALDEMIFATDTSFTDLTGGNMCCICKTLRVVWIVYRIALM